MTSAGLRAWDGSANLCETAGEGEIKPLEKVALARARPMLDRFGWLKKPRQRLEEKERELAKLWAELAGSERRLPGFFEGDAPVFFVLQERCSR